MLTYREEYKEYLDDNILRCLTCIQTDSEVKGFSCLIHYLKERYRSNLFNIKYYILNNFKPTTIEKALGEIYKVTFIEIIKDLLDNKFNEILEKEYGLKVEKGTFGADMKVTFTNDGPVTIILDSNNI